MTSPAPQIKEDFITLVQLVGQYFDISPNAIIKPASRGRATVYARQCVAYFAVRLFPSLTMSELGKMLGTDHTGIYYALKTLRERIITTKKVKADLDTLNHKITAMLLPASEESIASDRSAHVRKVAEKIWEELKLIGTVTKEDFASYVDYAFKQDPYKPNSP